MSYSKVILEYTWTSHPLTCSFRLSLTSTILVILNTRTSRHARNIVSNVPGYVGKKISNTKLARITAASAVKCSSEV